MKLKTSNLTKVYKRKKVLDIPDLELSSGEVFGLVGNNGAGKTTFIRLILDLIKANSGEVFIDNKSVSKHEEWKQFTGSFIDDSFLIPFLTPEEYFGIIADVYKIPHEELNNRLDKFSPFFANEIMGQKKLIREFSQGNKRKVGIVASLIINPNLLILDEPFVSLDPSSQFKLVEIINELRQQKDTTMIISSHDLEHIVEICDRIAVIEKGQIVKDLPVNETSIKQLKSYFSV